MAHVQFFFYVNTQFVFEFRSQDHATLHFYELHFFRRCCLQARWLRRRHMKVDQELIERQEKVAIINYKVSRSRVNILMI